MDKRVTEEIWENREAREMLEKRENLDCWDQLDLKAERERVDHLDHPE